MFKTLRLYLDKIPETVDASSVLEVFRVFEKVLGVKYHHIEHMLWNPDKDEMIIDKNYTYDEKGINRFLQTPFELEVAGKYGYITAPSFVAFVPVKDYFTTIRSVSIDFACGSKPSTIIADFKTDDVTHSVTLQRFAEIITRLNSIGYSVNNSFYNEFRRQRDAQVQDGFTPRALSCRMRMISADFFSHQKHGYLNNVQGVYKINSCPKVLIDDEKLADILGKDKVIICGDSVVFETPSQKRKAVKTVLNNSAYF